MTQLKIYIAICLAFCSFAIAFGQAKGGTTITYTPTTVTVGATVNLSADNASGVFSGDYVTDKGSGNGTFIPPSNGTYIIYYYKKISGELLASVTIIVGAGTHPSIVFDPPKSSFCPTDGSITITGATGSPTTTPATPIVYRVDGNITTTFNPGTIGTGDHTITASYTYNAETVTASTIFTVNPLPTVQTLSASSLTYCVGGSGVTLTLSNSESGVNYQLSGGALKAGTGGPLTWPNITTGTYSVTATNATTGCTSTMSGTPTISTTALPTSIISGSAIICNGTSTNLSVDFTGTSPWTLTLSDGRNITTSSDPVSVSASPSSTTTYTVTSLKDANNCSATSMTGSATVTVNPRPTATISGGGTICNGQSSTLTINFTGSGPWDFTYTDGTTPTLVSGITANPYTFTVTPTATKTYSLTTLKDTKCTAIASDLSGNPSVIVNGLPTVNAGSDVTTCAGDLVNLTATGATSYVWDKGTSLNTAVNPVSPTTTTTYTVTGTTNGCSASDQVTISVNPLPAGNAGTDVEICYGQSTTLTASGGGTYLWTTGETTPTITVSPISTTNYAVTVTNAFGCKYTDNVTVTVNPLPTVKANVSDGNICHGESTVLSAASSGGTGAHTYTWTPSGKEFPTITENPTNTTTLPIIYPYSVLVKDSKGCTATDDTSFIVNPLPIVSINNLAESYCRDAGATTIQGVPTGVTGSFTINSGTINDLHTGYAVFTPSANAAGTNYTIGYTYTDGNGCKATTIRNVLIRNELSPIIDSISNLDPLYCESDGTTYTVRAYLRPSTLSGTYTINEGFTPGGDVTPDAIDPKIAYFIPSALGLGNYNATYTYTVNYTSPSGQCSGSLTEPFTVGIPVVMNVNPKYCVSTDSFLLTATSTVPKNIGTFTIYRGIAPNPLVPLYSKPEGEAKFYPKALGAGEYTIQYSTTSAYKFCSGTTTATTRVYNLPSAAFTFNDTLNSNPNIDICINGGIATLAGKPNAGGTFSSSDVGVLGNTFNPLTAGAGFHNIKYVFTDANSCTNTDSAKVEVLIAPPATIEFPSNDTIFCHSDGPVKIIGKPADDGHGAFGIWTPPTGWDATMLKDNGDGSATLYPTNVPLGINYYTIRYSVKQPTGCPAVAERKIIVNYLPTVDFAGLPTSICVNANQVLLTSNHASGTFTGNGISDNGDGTASFNPNGLAIISHPITYTYTEATTTCTNSVTKNTTILQKPALFTVTGGGTYCVNNPNLKVGLSGSESGTTYTLLLNGASIGSKPGDGNPLDFGIQSKPGTYTITAINAPNACSETMTGSAIFIETPLPQSATTINGTNSVCPGASYTYSITPATLLNTDSYVWTLPAGASFDTPNGSNTVKVLFAKTMAAGTYTIKVKGNNSCGDGSEISYPITVLPLPAHAGNISGDKNVCQSESLVTYSVPAITNAVSYVWTLPPAGATAASGSSNKDIVLNFSSTALSGSISVAGVNACGVGDTSSFVINVVATPTVSIDIPTDVINCKGVPVTLNAIASPATCTYNWVPSLGGNISGASNIANPKASTAGTYTVTVHEPVHQCSASASVIVTSDFSAPENVSVSSDIGTILTCTQPQAKLTATTTSTYPVTYSWVASAGGNITSATTLDNVYVDKAGIYTVTITNTATGCSTTASITLTENKVLPVITITPPTSKLTCANALVSINSSAPGASYLWTGPVGATFTGGNTIANPQVDKAGTYTLTATGTNGCVATATTTVNEDKNLPLGITISVPATLTCATTSISLTGNSTTAAASYKWSTTNGSITSGVTNQLVTLNAPGTYTLTVTHPTSICTDSKSVTVIQDTISPVIAFPTVPTAITCSNTTSSITPTVTAAGALDYEWTGPGITTAPDLKDITVNLPGTYSIKATNTANQCIKTRTISVTDGRSYPTVSIAAPSVITCTNPAITLAGTTNITNYTAAWTGPAGGISGSSSNLNASVTLAGTYTLTVTDKTSGCQTAQNVSVTSNQTAPFITVDKNPSNLTCAVSQVTLSGFSTSTGATLKWTGPAGATISDETSVSPKVNTAGIYTLTVTGTNGCTSSDNVTVVENKTVPTKPIILTPSVITCNQPTVNLTVSPSYATVSYKWTTTGPGTITNANLPTATVNAAGPYKVVATDLTNGCTNEESVTVSENKTGASISIVNTGLQISCSSPQIELDASASTGINPVWSASLGGHIYSNGNTLKPTIDAKGSYTLTLANATTGCTSTSSVSVTSDVNLPALLIDPFPAKITCTNTQVTLSGQPNEANTSFTWTASPGNIVKDGTTYNPIVDQPGTYILTVTKTTTGCKSVASVTVEKDVTSPSLVIATPAEISCSVSEVTITASTTSPNVSYAWTTTGVIKAGTEATSTPVAQKAGNYTVILTNLDNNCTATQVVNVAENKIAPTINVNKTPANITCKTTQVNLSGSSLTTNATYLWTTTGTGNIYNETTKTPTVDAAGDYTLTVTNPANGCTATDVVTVSPNTTAPDIWVNTTPLELNGVNPTVKLSGGSATANVSYLWTGSGSITTPTSTETYVDKPGTYYLTVTSTVSGCTSTLPVVVTQNIAVPTAPVATGASICFGSPTATLTAIGNAIKWYSDASLAVMLHQGNTFTPSSYTTVGDHYFFVTQTDASSLKESASTQVTYTIKTLPASPVAVNNTVCQGFTNTALSANGVAGASFKWYDLPSGGTLLYTGNAYTPSVAVVSPGLYSYYVTQTNTDGCESAASQAQYTIYATPAKPVVDKTSASICFGAVTPSFTASGDNINWYSNTSLTTPIFTGKVFTPSDVAVGTYNYYVTQSVNGCVSDYETVTYTINPLPSIFNVNGGGMYCQGNAGVLVGLDGSQNNVSYKLYLNGSTLINTVAGTGAAFNFGLQKTAGTYTATATTIKNCTLPMAQSQVVSISPLPGAASAITGDNAVCQGETSVQYSVPSISNATSYVWSVPVGASITSGQGTNSITVDYSASAIDGVVSVKGENACGLGTSSALSIDVVSKPQLSVNTSQGTLTCGVTSLTLASSSSTAGVDYSWGSLDGGHIVGDADIANPTIDAAGTYTVTVTEPVNGCITSESVIVPSDYTAPQGITVKSDIGSVISCKYPQATLTASTTSTFDVSYSWVATGGGVIVSGETTSTPIVNATGNYTVTVTNNTTGCSSIGSITLTEDKVVPIITTVAPTNKLNCVTAKVSLSASATGASYLWTGPAGATFTGGNNISNPQVDKAGTYTITATGTNGCTATASISVFEDKSYPTGVAIAPPATLNCSATSIQLTGSSTTPSATYSWTTSNGSITSIVTNPLVTVNKPGTYTLTVKHPTSFCSQSTSVTVAQDTVSPIIAFPATPTSITCSNTTSSITANVTASATCNLSWAGPGITSDASLNFINVNKSGIYSITATNPSNYCTKTRTITVADGKSYPTVSIAAPAIITCTTPTVTLSGTTSATSYTAAWAGPVGGISGSTSNINASVKLAGTYTLTVTNKASGCQTSQSVLVTADQTIPDITVDKFPAQLTCTVSQVELSGSSATPSATLAWTGPAGAAITDANSNTPKVNATGTYTLTVTAPNGCTSSDNVTVSEDKTTPVVPSINTPKELSCSQKTVNLEVSPLIDNVSYQWSTTGTGSIINSTLPTATVNAIGTYKVVVTNLTSGCTNENSVVVTENKVLPTVSIVNTGLQISCGTPKIQLDASTSSGSAPVWTPSLGGHVYSDGNTLKPYVDAAGTYTLTLTDATTGCTASKSVAVTADNSLPTLTIDPYPAKITCSKTTVTLSGKPNETGTTFLWTASPGHIVSGDDTYNPIVDQKGTYILTVTKTATGCKNVASVTVEEDKTAPSLTIATPAQITCSNKEVTISASTTSGNVSYTWTTSGSGSIKTGTENTSSPIVSSTGTYTLLLTNLDNNCTATKDVSITQNLATPLVNVDKNPSQITCSKATVTLSGSSLTPGATLLWTTSGTGNILNKTSKTPTVDAIGTYTLTVTDPANGCTATDNVDVTSNTTPPNIWVNTSPLELNGINKTVKLSGNSSTSNVSYLWTGPGNISSPTSTETDVDAPGTYYLTVTSNTSGCTSTLPVLVTQNNTKPSAPVATGASICFGSPTATLSATGNAIKWYSDASLAVELHQSNTFTPSSFTAVGTYLFFVTQTDASSLVESEATQVSYTVKALPAAPTAVDNAVCQGSANTELTVVGAANSTFKWYTLPTGGSLLKTGSSYTPPASVVDPGTYAYFVTQTNTEGCESTASQANLTINPLLILNVDPNPDVLTCSTPEVTLNGSANIEGANLLWTGLGIVSGETTSTPKVNMPGVYTLTATHSVTGCSAVAPVSVTVNQDITLPTVEFPSVPAVITCSAPTVSVAGSTKISNPEYQWTTSNGVIVSGSTISTIVVSSAGTYQLAVKNLDNGCSASSSIEVLENLTLPNVSIATPSLLTCSSPSVTLIGSSTSSPVTVSWAATNGGIIPLGSENTFTPNISQPGTYKMKVISSNNGCENSASVVVVDDRGNVPVISINPSPEYLNCKNTQVQLYGSAPNSSLTWSGPAGANIVSPNSTNPWINKTGTYTLLAKSYANGCTSSRTVDVQSNIPSNIDVIIDAPDTISCRNTSVQLTGHSNITSPLFNWSTMSGGNITSTSNAGSITVNGAGQYMLVITDPNSSCTNNSVVTVYNNFSAPEISFPTVPASLTCSNLTTMLNSTVTTTTSSTAKLTWTGPGSISNPQINNPTVNAAGNYILTAIDSVTGCTASNTLTVLEDKSLPVVSINTPEMLTCSKTSVILTGTTSVSDFTASWTTTNGNISGASNLITATVTKRGYYTLTITNNVNGCQASKTIYVGEDVKAPDVVVDPNPLDISCTNAEVELFGSSSTSNVSLLWTGPGVVSNSASTRPKVNIPGTYTLTVTAKNGCKSVGTVVVAIDTVKPLAPVILLPDTISCKKPSVTVSVSNPLSTLNYSWTTTGTAFIETPNSFESAVNGIGKFTVKATNKANGCSTTSSITVVENVTKPTVSVTGGPYVLSCTTKTLIITSSSTNGYNPVWSTTNGGHVVSGEQTFNPVVDGAGNYSVKVTHAASGCTASANVSVTADNSLPPLNIMPFADTLTCSRTTVTLSGSPVGANTFVWTAEPGHFLSDETTHNPKVDQPGTYVLTVTDIVTGCINKASVTVKQNLTAPVIAISKPDSVTCKSSEIQLHASSNISNVSYLWSTSGTGVIKSGYGNTANPTVLAVGNYTLTVTNLSNGCSANKSVTVAADTIHPQIVVNKNPDKLTCERSKVILSGNSIDNVTYWWTSAAGVSIINANTAMPTVSAIGTYVLNVTDKTSGCTSKDSVTVAQDKITPNISVDVTPDSITCTRDLVQLSGSSTTANVTYSWSGIGNISLPDTRNPYVDSKGIYTLRVYNPNNGCSATADVTVIENKVVPAAPSVISAENCVQSITESLSATGSLLKWYNNSALSSTNLVASGSPFMPPVKTVGKYQYYVTQTDVHNGCESTAAVATFSIIDRSAKPEVKNAEVCYGQTVPFLSATGENIQWYDAPNGNLISTGNTLNTGKTDVGTYTFYATQTQSSVGCESNAVAVQLTIHAIPSAPVASATSNEICYGSSAPSLSVTGNNVNWYTDNTLPVSVYAGNNYTPNISVIGTYHYYATQTSVYGCQSPATQIDVVIKDNPVKYNVSGGGEYCEGGDGMNINLSGSNTGVNYKLLLNGAFSTEIMLTGNGSALSFGKQKVSGTYSVIATSANNCTSKMNGEVPVIINPLPENGHGISGDGVVCQGSTHSFVADSIAYANSYIWTLPAGASLISGGNSRTISVYFDKTATSGSISVKGVNNCGEGSLSSARTIEVSPLPELVIGSITGESQVCRGAKNVIYSIPEVSNATSYEWTIPAGAVITKGSGTNQIVVDFANNDIGGSFIVRGVNSCGTGVTSTPFNVKLKNLPVAYAGLDQGICSATTTIVATPAESGAIGKWESVSGPSTIANTSSSTSKVDNLMMGENTFVWSVTLNGCTTADTVVISNNKLLIDAGDDQVLCSKTTAMKATPLENAQWSIVSGRAVIYNNTSPTTEISGLQQGNNVLSWFVYKGSCLSSDTVILVNDKPITPMAGPDQVIKSDFAQLVAIAPEGGTNGKWNLLSGAGIIASPTSPTSGVTNLNPGANLFQWTVTRNGCSLSDTVTIYYESTEIADAGPDQIICSSSTTLAGNEPMIGIGQWSVISGTAYFANPKKYNTKVTGLAMDQNVLVWTIRSGGSSIVSDTVIITNNSTTISNAGRDQVLCVDSTALSAGPAIYGAGKWSVVSGAGTFANDKFENTQITKLGPGKNVLKWLISKGNCYSESTVTIQNNKPTTANAGADLQVCTDSVVLTPNTPSAGTGGWSIIEGSAIIEGYSASQLAANKNVLRWTITNGSCTSSDDITIISHKPSPADAGVNQSICVDSIKLGGNKPLIGTGVWTVRNGSGVISDTLTAQPFVTNMATGNNIFRWTITNYECVVFDEVEIYNGLIVADAGKDAVLCDDKTILSANSPWPGTGSWSVIGSQSAAVFVNQDKSNSQVKNLEKGNNILRWTIVNRTCKSFDEVVITNNLPTQAYAGPDLYLCGTQTNLDANPVVVGKGKWELLSGSAFIHDSALHNTLVDSIGLGMNILRWTTSNKGCQLTDDVKVYNNQPVMVSAGKDQVLCDDSTSLYANVPTIGIGQWSVIKGSAHFEASTSPITSVTNLAKGTNTFLWTVSSGRCKVVDTVLIINNLPTISMAGAKQILCSDSTTLSGNKPNVGLAEWRIVNGSADIEDINKYNTKITHIGKGENILRWFISNELCNSFSDVVIINNLPSSPYGGINQDLCTDSTVIYADIPEVGTGKWSLISGIGTISDPYNNQTPISDLGFGPNTFRWTTTNNSCSLSSDIVITNNLAEVEAGADQIIFTPSTTLIGNNPLKGNGKWELTAGDGSIEKPSSYTTTVTNLGAGNNTFSWTIENNGCIASDMVNVAYYIMPVPKYKINTDNGCPPLEIVFENQSIGGSPYYWDFGDSTYSDQSSVTHVYDKPGVYKVSMRATAPGDRFIFKDTVITVHSLPEANFEYSPKIVYIPGQSVNCFNTSKYAETYVWSFGDGSQATSFSPKYEYKDTGLFDIQVKAITKFGCTDSFIIKKAVNVEYAGNIVLPNAFTPNPSGSSGGRYNSSDFSNDVFYPIVINEGISDYKMQIFNRWGIKVFETTDIAIGWDGYYKGKLVEQDVYVYIVTGINNNGHAFNKIGDVLLIRKE
jgi:hypothetical protein